MSHFRRWLSDLLARRGTTAFLLAAVILGTLVGLGGAILVWAIEFSHDAFGALDDLLGWGKWFVLVAIPIGILIAWGLDRRFGPGVASGGVTEAMVGVGLHGGYLPTRLIPTKIIATAATLGAGGSGGREGPIALIGGAIGSSFSRYTGFGQDHVRSLVAAGAGAGIGASFNAPIAGMLFAMEVILRSFSVRHLNAIVITSVIAAVTTHLLVGEERLLTSPEHDLNDPRQLILYVALALLAVLFGVLFLRVLSITSGYRLPGNLPGWLVPVGAGLGVAAIGIADPKVLGTGQVFLSGLLAATSDTHLVWWSLFILATLKIIATSLTRAGGGSVGTFMAALFIGGSIGAGFATLVDPIWTLSEIDPGAFAVVGMAATFAAVARAPLTSVIIVFEITGDYGLVLPLMLGAALATYLGERLHTDSAYTIALTKSGIHLPTMQDIDLLDTVNVADVMAIVDEEATPSMTVTDVRTLFDRHHHHGLPVIQNDQLIGVVSLSDVENVDGDTGLTVADVMTRNPITATPQLPVSAALARMASFGLGRLPVVDDANPTLVVGMFRRESVVRAYHHALGTATGRELYRERVRLRSQPGAAFFETSIMRASPISNQSVRDVPWPEGAILVSIRRDTSVLIPHGNTRIEPGDKLTFFGTGAARVDVGHLMEPTEEQTGDWRFPR
ncbi:MAG: chloride channel protein [Actinomycetota bacterium]|nr:chloride channel protein [Actinomycetota bacterium]